MRFENSIKDLQKAIKDLEKASKASSQKKGPRKTTNQIDMFAMPQPSNDVDIIAMKKQLDASISSVETLLKESA